jgi:hypothetical protein
MSLDKSHDTQQASSKNNCSVVVGFAKVSKHFRSRRRKVSKNVTGMPVLGGYLPEQALIGFIRASSPIHPNCSKWLSRARDAVTLPVSKRNSYCNECGEGRSGRRQR